MPPKQKFAPLPKMPSPGTRPRPPRLPQPVMLPTGPNWLRKKEQRIGGPGDPPPGFVIGSTSKSEWWAYWALDIVMKQIYSYSRDVRQPPFIGFPPYWGFQTNIMEGRRVRGGSVADFTVNVGGVRLLIRIQTDRYHLATSSFKHASDLRQKLAQSGAWKVIDVFERDLMTDKTGAGAVKVMKEAVAGKQRDDPLRAGTFRRLVQV